MAVYDNLKRLKSGDKYEKHELDVHHTGKLLFNCVKWLGNCVPSCLINNSNVRNGRHKHQDASVTRVCIPEELGLVLPKWTSLSFWQHTERSSLHVHVHSLRDRDRERGKDCQSNTFEDLLIGLMDTHRHASLILLYSALQSECLGNSNWFLAS